MTFLTESEQRMLNSPTFCEILLTENIFIRFSGRKMPNIPEKSKQRPVACVERLIFILGGSRLIFIIFEAYC